jgi:hypothetical protein
MVMYKKPSTVLAASGKRHKHPLAEVPYPNPIKLTGDIPFGFAYRQNKV